MIQYEELKISVIMLEKDDVVRMSLGDNEVPEIGGNEEGGIFG